jgi:hypothetical protein
VTARSQFSTGPSSRAPEGTGQSRAMLSVGINSEQRRVETEKKKLMEGD